MLRPACKSLLVAGLFAFLTVGAPVEDASAFDLRGHAGQIYLVSGKISSAWCRSAQYEPSYYSKTERAIHKLENASLDLSVFSDAGVYQNYHIHDIKRCLGGQIAPHFARGDQSKDFPTGASVQIEVFASKPPDECRGSAQKGGPFHFTLQPKRDCDFYEVRGLNVDGRKVY